MKQHIRFLHPAWVLWSTLLLMIMALAVFITGPSTQIAIVLKENGCISDYWALLSGIMLLNILSEDWESSQVVVVFLNRLVFVLNAITIFRLLFCVADAMRIVQ